MADPREVGLRELVLHPVRLNPPAARLPSGHALAPCGTDEGGTARTGKRAAQSAMSRRALHAVLSWHLGRKIEGSEFRRTQDGKPYLASGALQFNLSHAGDWAFIAVSQHPVGVDLEINRLLRGRTGIASYFEALAGSEGTGAQGGMDVCSGQGWQQWCLAEAVSKCIGTGMTVPLGMYRLPRILPTSVTRIETAHGPVWAAPLPCPAGLAAYGASRHPIDALRLVGGPETKAALSNEGASTRQEVDIPIVWTDIDTCDGLHPELGTLH